MNGRVLIADDERSIRVTLREFLREAQYEVDVAVNGQETLDLIGSNDYDVLLADIIMPGMTGVKLLEALKDDHPRVQTILMTGEPTVETASHAVRGGAFDYLAKPISKHDVLKCVANACRLKASEDERIRLEGENREYRDTLEALVEERTEELHQSGHRYRNLFNEAATPLWEQDFSAVKIFIDGLKDSGVTDFRQYFADRPDQIRAAAQLVRIISTNRLVLELHGVESEEELGETLTKWFSEESYEGFLSQLIAIADGDSRCYADAVIVDSNGRAKDIRVEWLVVAGCEETLERVYVSTPDITERKRLEESLRRNEALLAETGKLAKIGGWDLNVETLEVSWTAETFRIHELPLDSQPPLEDALDYYHPDDRPVLEAAVQRALNSGEAYDLELRLVTAAGRPLWVHTTCFPKVVGGKTIRLSGTLQDITKRKESSLALARSEQRFRSLFENAPVCIHEIDLDGKMLSMNPAGLNLAGGVPESDVVGLEYIGFVRDSEKGRVQKLFDRATTGIGSKFEYQGTPTLDNHSFWSSFIPIPGADGTVDRIMGVSDDITEKIQATADAERFGQVLEHTLNEIYLFDAESLLFVGVNKGGRENLGYSAEELAEMTPADLKPEFSLESFSELIAPIRAGDKNLLHFESVHRRKDGSTYPVDVYLQLIRETRPVFVGIVIDTTERQASRQQLSRLATVVDQSAVTVLITDLEGSIVYANPQAEMSTGYSVDDLVGQPPSMLAADEAAYKATTDIWNQVATGQGWTGVLSNRRNNGDRYFDETTVFPIRGEEGQIINFASVQKDITERVLLAEERERLLETINEQARQELDSQQRISQQDRLAAVGQLAAGIAHDFNNIMGIINLYATLLQRTPGMSPESSERLSTILEQAKHATGLTQQILDFGRRSALEQQPTDMAVFLSEIVDLLGHTIPENISIELESDSADCLVNADPTRIQQVLMNLAVNARDAMPDGGALTFQLKRLSIEAGSTLLVPEIGLGEWILVSVIDTGHGIPADKLDYIFEPFFTTKPPGKGTGLGLSQVYGILKQHGGHISVESEEGLGTTFSLVLPALKITAPKLVPEDLEAVHGHGETLLVVEDNETLRQALCETLEPLNYRVLQVDGGVAALTVLDEAVAEISLVISDLVMPQMGGKELFLEMKRRGSTVPVIVLTGHLMEDELQELRGQGLAGWMLKPPDPERLSQLIDRVLTASSSSLLEED
ncbi:PAS domain S-box protein [Rhodothermus sp. AH-315-K08]|nr:PAS domain S-box protein [Rhodothermus sp. AH-315-K08]